MKTAPAEEEVSLCFTVIPTDQNALASCKNMAERLEFTFEYDGSKRIIGISLKPIHIRNLI